MRSTRREPSRIECERAFQVRWGRSWVIARPPGRLRMPSTTERSWIQKTPDVCGGDACIRNTRIPVWSLVAARRLGASDEELLHYFVTPLTPADVQAGWGYYVQHPDEIDLE